MLRHREGFLGSIKAPALPFTTPMVLNYCQWYKIFWDCNKGFHEVVSTCPLNPGCEFEVCLQVHQLDIVHISLSLFFSIPKQKPHSYRSFRTFAYDPEALKKLLTCFQGNVTAFIYYITMPFRLILLDFITTDHPKSLIISPVSVNPLCKDLASEKSR